MLQIFDHAGRARGLTLALFDGSAWVLGFLFVTWMQMYVGYDAENKTLNALLVGIGCGLSQVILSRLFRLHQGRAPIASFDDAVNVGAVWIGIYAIVIALGWYGMIPTLVSVVSMAPVAAICIMLGGRVIARLLRQRAILAQGASSLAERESTIVIGAGDAAKQLITDLMSRRTAPWYPVALLDDDEFKRHRRLSGIPVKGKIDDLERVAKESNATTAILAVPSAAPELIKKVNKLANAAGLDLKVLPNINDLNNPARVNISDVRDIEVTDFLGRQPMHTDVDAIAHYVTGKKVLVTGAGGSIGSELCRQLYDFRPAELIMLDRDESALHTVQLSIHGKALLDGNDTELGDIRDARFVDELFARRKPDVVFHAAALKHLPLLEASPGEAVKTNVWGTQNVLEAARKHGVKRFVNVSTDKAANPCSVLGYSKRLAEGLTSSMSRQADGKYMSVRFGNVLGSRGSVLTAFTAQIANGGPVTVTDPNVTRFFMTIAEAVELTIQAGAIGDQGDVLVLDMGEPVSIKSMAEQLIELSGQPIEIVFTGLREGEKMDEELFGDGEVDVRPIHPLISHAKVPAFSSGQAAVFDACADPAVISGQLATACTNMLQLDLDTLAQ
jgi:FlaA1/EpsC-like NDP-sugar epimerase